jgi:tRNA A-37 threonylcarbamoyl transferase component Bud32
MTQGTPEVQTCDSGRLLINAAYAELLQHNQITSAGQLWELESSPVKNILKTRGTSRTFLLGPASGEEVEVYLKRYLRPSLKERCKCALSLKPVFLDGALHEWRALCRFLELGLPTMVPIAAARLNGRTCNLTLGITDYVRASDFFSSPDGADPERRTRVIRNIAALAGMMHAKGLSHQDFYLVHIFIKPGENDAVYLIDLQRTIMQEELSRRWRVKDLAQITFSTEAYFSTHEMATFRDIYMSHNAGLKTTATSLWQSVERKANRIRQHTLKHHM